MATKVTGSKTNLDRGKTNSKKMRIYFVHNSIFCCSAADIASVAPGDMATLKAPKCGDRG